MKIVYRFYDNDLRDIVAKSLNIPKDQVTSIYTEEEKDDCGNVEPIFYIEAEVEPNCTYQK